MQTIIRIVHAAILFMSIIYNPCISFSKSKMQNYCPFTTFCTNGPRINFTNFDDEASPCCSQCACGDDCWVFGTCCPDAKALSKGASARTVCQSNLLEYSRNVVPDSFDKRILEYLMIISCPSSYTNVDTIERCINSHNIQPDAFDDIVTVSDIHNHGRIYKNKFCAACNGVTDVIRYTYICIILYFHIYLFWLKTNLIQCVMAYFVLTSRLYFIIIIYKSLSVNIFFKKLNIFKLGLH